MLSRPTSIRSSSPSAVSTVRTLVNDDTLGPEHFDLPLPPAAITIDRSTCYSPEPPSPLEDYPEPPPANIRHRVPNAFWENLPPLIARATSPNLQSPVSSTSPQQLSPTKSLGSFITNQGTDTSTSRASTAGTRAKHTSRASLFGNFFNVNATSEPVNIGVLPRARRGIEEEEEDDSADEESDMEYTGGRPGRPRRAMTSQSSSTTSSRFAWLTSKASALTSSKAAASHPAPPPATDPLLTLDVTASLFPHGPADPLAPPSFHDLLANAEALIARLQAGYRAQTAALADLRRERAAQAEERDEADTRAAHLRAQLQEMGRRMAEADRANADMAAALAHERRRWREEEERRCRSVRIVQSAGSDSGFEDDAESESGSVCGGRDAAEGQAGTDELKAQLARAVRVKRVPIGSDAVACRSCHGIVMGTSDLRNENHVLRIRVAELEEAVEGCLDLVGARSGP